MQFFTLATLLIAGSATAFANPLEKRTNQKANEYVSGDCSGPINFGHVGQAGRNLVAVNMDPSSHSVYLAGTTWRAWTTANLGGNGHHCSGTDLGTIGGACQNLDSTEPGNRIACISTS